MGQACDQLKSLCLQSHWIWTSTISPINRKYLNNRICYDKIVWTITISSRWWVYWYELFSVLSPLQNCQNLGEMASLYNKGIFTNFGYFFSWHEILISLECAVDSEQNGVIDSVVSCSVVELFITEATKIMILWCLTSCVHRSFASGKKKCWSTSDNAWPCTWSTMHNRQ